MREVLVRPARPRTEAKEHQVDSGTTTESAAVVVEVLRTSATVAMAALEAAPAERPRRRVARACPVKVVPVAIKVGLLLRLAVVVSQPLAGIAQRTREAMEVLESAAALPGQP